MRKLSRDELTEGEAVTSFLLPTREEGRIQRSRQRNMLKQKDHLREKRRKGLRTFREEKGP